MIRRACTCDEGGACEHVAAVGLAFADAIEEEPAQLLRWRGCLAGEDEAPSEDTWVAGELPAPGEVRAFPAGAMLKRLGPSGIAVGDEDLARCSSARTRRSLGAERERGRVVGRERAARGPGVVDVGRLERRERLLVQRELDPFERALERLA